MYPQQELTRLAAHKAALRRDITFRRIQCAETAALAVWPLAWLDKLLAFGRRHSPFVLLAAVPLGWVGLQTMVPRLKVFVSNFFMAHSQT
jgi:hypothetical protein